MKKKFIIFLLLSFLFPSIGASMKPYRPDLMIFISPDKKLELHSPIHEKSVLIKKKLMKNEKVQWADNMNVDYMFSDPSSNRIFTLGGLGDAGTDLGIIHFYSYEGIKKTINLKDALPNIEELSHAEREFTNFPWISAIDINEQELLIWVCNKVLAKISFKDLKTEIVTPKSTPEWVRKLKDEVVSSQAKKYQWNLKD